ncbi:RimJ/RimL family protein N-acetyltransferase [Stackebrandtia albiflava]|uniref:RimJ/RimL family protein N-acetyltransferase n=1 Tax=Stackebrandtia albiflava TaxID=406432 RepID=A0A562VDN5_9ACTN|nr:GNAT family N-acetyltransferase [Stackebrandtia albiflava]TWJ15993.1 RimJ/RimL family protein N-acetyltransferase [Stackebrandtia albiflava]
MTDTWPDRIEIRPLTADDAALITRWRYDGPWRVYDSGEEALTAEDGYLAVTGADGGPLLGFCCTGVEARVPGLTGEPGLLDVGVGMDPALVGRGHGRAFGEAVLGHLHRLADGRRLRAVVQSWNVRSLRLAAALGFVATGVHTCEQGGRDVEYTVLVTTAREPGPDTPPGTGR